ARAGSPIQPSASDDIVMPSWQAARLASRLLTDRWRATAFVRPAATSSATLVRRTATSENSAATKNPFARTRNPMANNPRTFHKLPSGLDMISSRPLRGWFVKQRSRYIVSEGVLRERPFSPPPHGRAVAPSEEQRQNNNRTAKHLGENACLH